MIYRDNFYLRRRRPISSLQEENCEQRWKTHLSLTAMFIAVVTGMFFRPQFTTTELVIYFQKLLLIAPAVNLSLKLKIAPDICITNYIQFI